MGLNIQGPSLTLLESLQSSTQQELLDVVDALRKEGLSGFLPLPQLIVCGDQSSGKSSVLEAISGVPFPRNENLCTRFATEVILRRHENEAAAVSITPGLARSESDRHNLLAFKRDLQSLDDLPSLVTEAITAMGLGHLDSVGSAFSTDVLRVEVAGPRLPQLTIVDLPGLIHSETKYQSDKDVRLVTELVNSYMRKERTIILAVVSAKNDYANQIVLKRARRADPGGNRTLGIITKPDTLHPESKSEESFVNLASNQDVKFKLGWHVVRNHDSQDKDTSREARDRLEKDFFSRGNWTALRRESVGIKSLRERLSVVLFQQIRQELPNLVRDIESGINECRETLTKLGRGRSTEEEQRLYLIELSQSFQTLCKDACDGNYDDRFFGNAMEYSNVPKRVRAVVQNESMAFEKKMRLNGCRWTLGNKLSQGDTCITREQAIDRVVVLLQRSRGRELPGTFNPLLIGELFRDYASPWEGLANRHVLQVWRKVKLFLENLARFLAEDEVCDALFRLCIDPLMDKKLKAAKNEVSKLTLQQSRHPMTYNHYFTENVAKKESKHKDEIRAKLQAYFGGGAARLFDPKDINWLAEYLAPKSQELNMDRVAANSTFDHMQAYYKVSHQ